MHSLWKFNLLQSPEKAFEANLVADWEVNGSALSDDYDPGEVSADELFERFRKVWENKEEDLLSIFWTVHPETATGEGKPEIMPFQYSEHTDNFLTYFTWPVNSQTGEPLNWLTLPVMDRYWRRERPDKGGFIQEATGWKPSILQPYVSLKSLIHARRP